MADWKIFRGNTTPHGDIRRLPEPPPWRQLAGTAHSAVATESPEQRRGRTYCASEQEIQMINAALYLRRPLLITGPPGSGKSSLAYAIAWELQLRPVLMWPINSRSTLTEGLYSYDALARLRDAQVRQQSTAPTLTAAEDIGNYLRLGPLGTALATSQPDAPRVLVIDEIDKSDIDLANDLLHVFEEGTFVIPELLRLVEQQSELAVPTWDRDERAGRVAIRDGRVRCAGFPLVILTSNGERELPPAFLRRCLRLTMTPPTEDRLRQILKSHLGMQALTQEAEALIKRFGDDWHSGKMVATDQLLNAVFLITRGVSEIAEPERGTLIDTLLRELNAE